MISVFIFRMIFQIIDMIEMYVSNDVQEEKRSIFFTISMIGRVPYLILFLMLYAFWFHLLRFFVQLKQKK